MITRTQAINQLKDKVDMLPSYEKDRFLWAIIDATSLLHTLPRIPDDIQLQSIPTGHGKHIYRVFFYWIMNKAIKSQLYVEGDGIYYFNSFTNDFVEDALVYDQHSNRVIAALVKSSNNMQS